MYIFISNIFSQFMASHFICLTVCFPKGLMKTNLTVCFFGVLSKKSSPIPPGSQ